VILFDELDRVLLFRVTGTEEKRPLWITPGGGLNHGETFEQAARRELWEETGLAIEDLGRMVWKRRHPFTAKGELLDEDERFFVAHCKSFEPHRGNFEAHEHLFMVEHRWWLVSEIADSGDAFAPMRMAELLPDLISGRFPLDPIDTGK
jgi:8-oxo-dGTP pyrophosphatase MutT (NUDIX family)